MRLYRLLLRLYPASFRLEYGEELCRLFADRRRSVSGPLSVPVIWLEEVLDLLRSALRAHGDILRQDLVYAARAIRRAPGFALTAVLVTALGIGATTAVFSVTDQVLIRPLPYREAHRLVKLWERQPRLTRLEASPPNYRDWQRLGTSFEAMAAYNRRSLNLVGLGEPQRVDCAVVTSNLLPLLGVRPLMGRLFTPDEDRKGAPGTVLLSYGVWQGLFGGDEDALGRTVRLDDEPYTVIGVLPREFPFPTRKTQLWMPIRLATEDFTDRDDNYLEVVARLKDGVSLDGARAEMAVIAQRLEREYPQENAQTGVTVSTLRDEASRQSRLLLAALSGASICVLLIACANLASLLLARALARRGELTVRAALGAGRERLARQLVTESLVLAVMGGVLGVLLAALAVPLLAVLAPTYLPVGEATALDRRVLGFAALVTGLTGLGFGVFPALRLGRDTDIGGLREGARGGLGGPRERLRAALVGAEVTAAVVLLISCGLLIRALWRVQATDPGFRTEGVLAVQTPVSMPKYASTTRRVGLYSEVLSGVRALPGVDGAAYISFLPMVMGGGIWPVQVEGAPRESSGQRAASLRFVTPDFFRTMGIPLRAGRDVRESDTADAPFVAVVSESFGRRYWPGQDPLGRRFNFGLADRIVVGVVGDIRVRGLERESEPQVYLAYKQVPDGSIWFYVPKELVIRSTSDAAPLAAAVRRIVRKADPELPIGGVRTLQEVVDADTAPRQTQLRLLGAFAALALLLAGIGIHGLLSFAVSQRRPEFGLRRALGARSGDILRMVLMEGIVLAAAGSALGVFLANAAGHAMEALLAGVPPGDTLTLLAAATVALLMTVSGSLVPAIRAVRVDPTTALRVE